MTELIEKFRIKNKSIVEAASALFDLNKFPKSFAGTFEITNIEVAGDLKVGSKVSMNLKKFGVSADCEYKVVELSETRLTYRQTCGLMKKWEHSMELKPVKEGVIELIDNINYEVPYGLLGHLANDLFLRTEVPSMLYDRLKILKLK